eukprot:6319524-Amphidinium_carterae.1
MKPRPGTAARRTICWTVQSSTSDSPGCHKGAVTWPLWGHKLCAICLTLWNQSIVLQASRPPSGWDL